jgi:serine/threonine protein phosphatase PrpC
MMSDTAKLTIPQPNTGYTTDPGRVREKNEDSFWVSPPTLDKQLVTEKGWLFIVADGMGGYQGGEVASAIVIKAASDSYYSTPSPGEGEPGTIMESLRQAVLDSQKAVLKHQSEDSEHSQMGSTLVMAVIRDSELYVANLGDSRCYRLRDGTLEQLSHDHSWVAEQVRTGLLSPDHVHGNVNRSLLTRALGQANAIVKPEIEKLDWRAGDRLLLCTDGLWDMVPDDNIRILLSKTDPQEAALTLVNAANAAGGSDNITAVVVGSIESSEMLPIAASMVSDPITNKMAAIQAVPSGLPRMAIIAIVALIVVILAALIILSQISMPATATPTGTVIAATAAAVAQRTTAVQALPSATAVEPTATASVTVPAKPTVTAVEATASPTVSATQSVSEAIAASTVVATGTPAVTPVATTTPLPILESKACVTRTVTISDWQKSTVATGVQPVAGGIAVWGLSHIATKQDLVGYLGLDQIHAPFTITVKALSSVKPAPGDLWACFQGDVNSTQCSNTIKGARSVTQVEVPGFVWAFSYPFTEQPTLPQLRLISLAKQKSPLTIMEIEFCHG